MIGITLFVNFVMPTSLRASEIALLAVQKRTSLNVLLEAAGNTISFDFIN